MNILHVIPSVAAKDGGPSFAAKAMADALAGRGVQVTIATTGEENEQIAQDAQPRSRAGCLTSVIYFRRNFEPYKVSFGLAKWLRENVSKFDLVHIHALFSFSSVVAARIAHKKNVPYVVRPLGVLNRWGMQNRRRLPKKISFQYLELPILLNSVAIHYTSEAERTEAAELNQKLAEHDAVVIPLPIGRVVTGDAEIFRARYPQLNGRRIILFLSRIDRKKGLELLMDAFAMVREKNEDVALVIAGDGEESYVRELQEHATRVLETTGPQTTGPRTTDTQQKVSGGRGTSEVIWTGHLSGEMKAAALAAADVFVLPSASENFGIAAAESLAAGVPTIVSEEVALSSDISRYDAGVVVRRDVQQLARAIEDLLSNRERAAALAANGRRLVEERYSPEAVGKALCELYQKCIASRT